MALGVAVMIAVIVIYGVAVRQFDQNAQGYHLIVGGKGGSLQLVLSTVYHIGQPLYPIPYSYYQKFLPGGEFAEVTSAAIPECLGDSYQSPDGSVFRIVATTPELFEKIHYGNNPDGSLKSYEFQPGGRNFKTENFFEGVIGSVVAARSGLKVGDTFQPSHGLAGGSDLHHAVKIVGILKPTGTADDRALFMNIEGFYLIPGHALSPTADKAEVEGEGQKTKAEEEAEEAREHEQERELERQLERGEAKPLPAAQREVTSILVLCNNPLGPEYLNFKINKGKERIAQAVAPAREVGMLLNSIVGPIRLVLLVLTVLVVIVAGISILVSIYNSMTERSHDIAVMRARGKPEGGDGDRFGGIDPAFTRRRIDRCVIGSRHDWHGESLFGRADRHCDEHVCIRLAGADSHPGAGCAGVAGRLFAGIGGVSDRRGEGAGGQPVACSVGRTWDRMNVPTGWAGSGNSKDENSFENLG